MLQTSGEHNLRLATSNGYRQRDILSTEEYNLPTHQALKKEGNHSTKSSKIRGGDDGDLIFFPPGNLSP